MNREAVALETLAQCAERLHNTLRELNPSIQLALQHLTERERPRDTMLHLFKEAVEEFEATIAMIRLYSQSQAQLARTPSIQMASRTYWNRAVSPQWRTRFIHPFCKDVVEEARLQMLYESASPTQDSTES